MLFELAAEGRIDDLAIPIPFGDDSVQGAFFTTNRRRGFTPEDMALGDSMLSILPVEEGGRADATLHAYCALVGALATAAQMNDLRFVGCLHIGPITCGNMSSSDRLDFTVVGPTVNMVSRLEALIKSTNNVAICSQGAAAFLPTNAAEVLGTFPLKDVLGEQVVFVMHKPDGRT